MKKIYFALPLLALISSEGVHATDGYFPHGYGVKSQGAGGVGIALPQDTLAIATNPAGLSAIGNRIDIGATWFRPIRESEIQGHPAPINGTYEANETKNFIIPEFGYSRNLSPQTTVGVAVYGHGGMNTDYEKPVPLFGNTKPGIDLAQLFIAPTLAYKITPTQSVGVSLNLAYQRFKAKGLQNFASPASESPNDVTNRGYDHSYGAGIHLGWQGQVNDNVTLGLHYKSKTYMSKFDKYKGLFANQGEFDIPSSYGAGIAVKATPKLTIAADIERINYSDVDSVGNSVSKFFTAQLGSDNGAGFGWQDSTVYKLGVIYAATDNLTLRAGYNHINQPIPSSQTLFNILAPGVVENHATLGLTWTFENKSELSFSYFHAFEHKVHGKGSIPAAFGGGEVDLKMYQDAIGVAYSWAL
ncbi:MAG TPA: TonB-dependent receptor [Methylophilus sp.]|nr:TonB-dependent receptor [Methylophilus sp.]HQQ33177.1 TonB-dependent receptor [Methylophilus sp.]